jgi:hypothetical protein
VNRLGLVRFLGLYAGEFARHWLAERSVHRAYRKISFEVEAYGEEGEATPDSANVANRDLTG